MHRRVSVAILAAAVLGLLPATSRANLSNYIQNFEGLVQTDVNALANDHWLVFGTVYRDLPGPPVDTTFFYQYGPFPAPNTGAAFCAIALGEGGAEQGAQVLSVYSDYNNLDHATGRLIESAVYREWTIGAGDVGKTWIFEFDAKLGNITSPTTALAFIKTIDPAAAYARTNFVKADMTVTPITWSRYSLSLTIDSGLVGQLFQIGFSNLCTNYVASGIFYDNIVVHEALSTGVEVTGSQAARRPTARVSPNPLNPAGTLSFRIPSAGPVTVKMFDLNGRLVRTLLEGEILAEGAHRLAIDGRDQSGARLSSGVYFYRVDAAGDVVRGQFTILK
jgi:hypothetical protein